MTDRASLNPRTKGRIRLGGAAAETGCAAPPADIPGKRSLQFGFGFGQAGSLDTEVQPVAGDHHRHPGEPERPADQDVGQPVVSQEDPA